MLLICATPWAPRGMSGTARRDSDASNTPDRLCSCVACSHQASPVMRVPVASRKACCWVCCCTLPPTPTGSPSPIISLAHNPLTYHPRMRSHPTTLLHPHSLIPPSNSHSLLRSLNSLRSFPYVSHTPSLTRSLYFTLISSQVTAFHCKECDYFSERKQPQCAEHTVCHDANGACAPDLSVTALLLDYRRCCHFEKLPTAVCMAASIHVTNQPTLTWQ